MGQTFCKSVTVEGDKAKREQVLLYRCSVLSGHYIGAMEVTVCWYAGALCWTEKINAAQESESYRRSIRFL